MDLLGDPSPPRCWEIRGFWNFIQQSNGTFQLKSRSNATRAHKTPKWLKNGPIWVRRPPDKCTGGETGPRKRFPLVPRPSEAKKTPKTAKIQSPKSKNGSKTGPIPTDVDETRGDLLPPMCPFVSPWSRDRPKPKLPNKCLSPPGRARRSTFRRSIFKGGCVRLAPGG